MGRKIVNDLVKRPNADIIKEWALVGNSIDKTIRRSGQRKTKKISLLGTAKNQINYRIPGGAE